MTNSEDDLPDSQTLAKISLKVIELAKSWGQDIVSIECGLHPVPHATVKNSEDKVISAHLNRKLHDGRQFVDYEMYSRGGRDYQSWEASSPEMFLAAIDEEIASSKAASFPMIDSRNFVL